jgi:hypothetical protein
METQLIPSGPVSTQNSGFAYQDKSIMGRQTTQRILLEIRQLEPKFEGCWHSVVERKEKIPKEDDIPKGRCLGDTQSSVWRVLVREDGFKQFSLGCPLEDAYSSCVFTLTATAWTEKGLSLVSAVLWIDSGRHRHPAPTGPLWQGRKGQGHACDSAALPSAFSAFSLILGTWLEHYPKDFCQPPYFACLKLQLNYKLNYCSALQARVR